MENKQTIMEKSIFHSERKQRIQHKCTHNFNLSINLLLLI